MRCAHALVFDASVAYATLAARASSRPSMSIAPFKEFLNVAKQYIVLDLNVLRPSRPENTELSNWLETRTDVHYVLPDVAFIEMAKSEKWESTLSNNLKLIAQYPGRVHIGYSVNKALDDELSDLKPVNGHMLNQQATSFVRDLLDSIHHERDGAALNLIRNSYDIHFPPLEEQHLNHEQNKGTLLGLVNEAKESLSSEILNNLRANRLTDSEKLAVIHQAAVSFLTEILCEDRRVSRERARMFLKQKPLVLRYIFLRWWYNICWIANGGVEAFASHKATNEEIDQHYVVTGTFFHGVLTNETRVKESYNGLCNLLRMKI